MSAGFPRLWARLLSVLLCGWMCSCALEEPSPRSGEEPDSVVAREGEDVVVVGDSDERETLITKGKEDPGHKQVGLIQMWTDTTYTKYTGICTGTLVGKRTVLTAAHCVSAGVPKTFVVGGLWYIIVSEVAHPDWPTGTAVPTPEQTANDIAVMILRDAPPIDPSPIAAQAPQLRSLLHLVGFGCTANGRTDWEIKRSATTMIWERGDGYYKYGEPIVGMGTTCSGDSGGPHFVHGLGRDVQVGVTSSGNAQTTGQSARLDRHIEWIRQQANGDVLVVNLPLSLTPASMGMDLFRPLGATCKRNIECASLSCTHDTRNGADFCAQACSERLPCPDWFECVSSQNLTGAGMCMPTWP